MTLKRVYGPYALNMIGYGIFCQLSGSFGAPSLAAQRASKGLKLYMICAEAFGYMTVDFGIADNMKHLTRLVEFESIESMQVNINCS